MRALQALNAAAAVLGPSGGGAAGAGLRSMSTTAGDVYALQRAFSGADVDAFTALTGDTNYIHHGGGPATSGASRPGGAAQPTARVAATGGTAHATRDGDDAVAAAAGRRPLQGPIVPGMLLASLFPAIIGTRFPGALYATQSLAFRCVWGEGASSGQPAARCMLPAPPPVLEVRRGCAEVACKGTRAGR